MPPKSFCRSSTMFLSSSSDVPREAMTRSTPTGGADACEVCSPLWESMRERSTARSRICRRPGRRGRSEGVMKKRIDQDKGQQMEHCSAPQHTLLPESTERGE
eukprot:5442576-Pleurochrysis_carterae.AAC.2